MHTSEFESCRIHHNGGYDGDIFITNKDSTSKPIGKMTEITLSIEKMIEEYTKLKKNQEIVIIEGKIEDTNNKEKITVLASDIKSFIYCILYNKISQKMGDINDIDTLIKISKILKIKLQKIN